MTKDATKLLKDALQLEPDDRAQIAEELLASLDERQEEIEQAWAAEIARRAADARQNPEAGEDWRAVLARVRSEVLKR